MENVESGIIVSDTASIGTQSALSWDALGRKEQDLILAVCITGSVEEARRKTGLTHGTFYRHWSKVKPFYNNLLNQLPNKANEILLAQSIKAAQELGNELDSENEKMRHDSAIAILNRSVPKESKNLKRKLTIEEFLGMDTAGNTL
jgi:hypothetical protein